MDILKNNPISGVAVATAIMKADNPKYVAKKKRKYLSFKEIKNEKVLTIAGSDCSGEQAYRQI